MYSDAIKLNDEIQMIINSLKLDKKTIIKTIDDKSCIIHVDGLDNYILVSITQEGYLMSIKNPNIERSLCAYKLMGIFELAECIKRTISYSEKNL
jgi:hypothetical protein